MCSLFSYQLLISFRNTSVFFLLIFFQLFCPKWDFSHGKFGWLSPGKASCDRVKLPYLRCILGVLEFHNPPKSEMDYMIFNVDTDVNACDCIRGCTDTIRESALKFWLWEKHPLLHKRIQSVLAACRSDALPTELHPHPCKVSDKNHTWNNGCCFKFSGRWPEISHGNTWP